MTLDKTYHIEFEKIPEYTKATEEASFYENNRWTTKATEEASFYENNQWTMISRAFHICYLI